ncbi:MAG: hypothetical protein V4489_08660 [Chlamydiota bacterium]
MSAISSSPNSSHRGIYHISGDSLQRCIGFEEKTTSDLNSLRLVNKVWKGVIDGPEGRVLWRRVSIGEGVPIVQGESRDHKDDFRFLLPITISSRIIGKYLGEVVGEVPLMREDVFTRLKHEKDSFEVRKFQRDTHVVIVDPSKLKITVSPNRPLRLDATETLEEVPVAERDQIVKAELTIPFSFKNLRMLAAYPLAGKEKGPVFEGESAPEVFELCNTPLDQNGILIMRRKVVGRNRVFNGEQGQNALVTNRGWKVVTVRQRGFYDAIEILKTGTCSDNRAPYTYARSAERISQEVEEATVGIIGGFAPNVGVFLSSSYGASVGSCGVVPGVSAEVPQP